MIVDGRQKKNIEMAVDLILAGDVVGFPTETVYGLGGDLLSPSAVSKIYQVKQRPHSDPLILHVAGHDQLDFVAEDIFPAAVVLIEKFWPGPLTLIFKKKKHVPDSVTAGLNTVAVRMPRHLVALALIKNSNRVIVAPSANRFQKISPTTAVAVEKELGDKIPLILDGGPCLVGIESTVLSLVDEPLLLRPGGISREDIQEVLGFKIREGKLPDKSLKMAPGLQDFHYAPTKPLRYFTEIELNGFIKKKRNQKILSEGVLICFSSDEAKKYKKVFKNVLILSNRGNLDEAGKNLFSFLRQADEGEYVKIFALECPQERLGEAINNRLKKAEHGF